jgi:hypothetical protein
MKKSQLIAVIECQAYLIKAKSSFTKAAALFPEGCMPVTEGKEISLYWFAQEVKVLLDSIDLQIDSIEGLIQVDE